MTRNKRTYILVECMTDLPKRLCAQIENKYEINVLEAPNNGLVMLKMRENSKRSLFYLGEVLVTECKVEINGVIGLGILNGLDEQKAYQLAVIDAAYNAHLPETDDWTALLQQDLSTIEEYNEQESARILQTKVNFETMDV